MSAIVVLSGEDAEVNCLDEATAGVRTLRPVVTRSELREQVVPCKSVHRSEFKAGSGNSRLTTAVRHLCLSPENWRVLIIYLVS